MTAASADDPATRSVGRDPAAARRRRLGRLAGALYLLSGVVGPFAFLYVPSVLRGTDPSTISRRIADAEPLLRAGVGAELFSAITLIFAAGALYALLSPVSRTNALLMFVLAALAAPLVFFSALAELAALGVVKGAGSIAVFAPGLLSAIARIFLDLHRLGLVLAQVFWGLWLIPLGLLVIASRFLPPLFGFLLIAAGFAYVAASLAVAVLPSWAGAASTLSGIVGGVAEGGFILWLLIRGARDAPA
jgi:uncharacterized protein DUF4386